MWLASGATIIALAIALMAIIGLLAQALTPPGDRFPENVAVTRTAFIQILGATAIAGTFVFTVRSFLLNERSHRGERFGEAVRQLGDQECATVRLGGVYGLRHLVEEDPSLRTTVETVLASFIRASGDCGSDDARAAMDTIASAPLGLRGKEYPPLDLRKVDLTGVNLDGANLQRVDLSGAILNNAVLRDAKLDNAILRGAELQNAKFQKARLIGADFRQTNLTETWFALADTEGADFRGSQGWGDGSFDDRQMKEMKGRPGEDVLQEG